MPPKMVKTIRDLIYWEHATLIARAAGFERNYRLIVSRFKKLQSGEIRMSDLTRDDRNMILKDEYCIYCGSTENLCFDHVKRIKGSKAEAEALKALLITEIEKGKSG
jgi:hypothetical protein